jgi:hypothetical protein
LFVGYALNHSAHTYRFYNTQTNHVILSRDVKWDDWKCIDPKGSLKAHQAQLVTTLLDHPFLSPLQKNALGELLSHYTKQPLSTLRGQIPPPNFAHMPQHQEDTEAETWTEDDEEHLEPPALEEAPAPVIPPLIEQEDEEEDEEQEDEEQEEQQNEEDESEEDEEPAEQRTIATRGQSRELRGLHTDYNPTIKPASRELRNLQINYVYSAITSDPGEPSTMKEALSGPERSKWQEAMKKEIANFLDRGVWKKISRNKVIKDMKRKLITTKWIYKKKVEQDQSIRYKARCVSRGFMQIPGVDYTESFAPVASDTSI